MDSYNFSPNNILNIKREHWASTYQKKESNNGTSLFLDNFILNCIKKDIDQNTQQQNQFYNNSDGEHSYPPSPESNERERNCDFVLSKCGNTTGQLTHSTDQPKHGLFASPCVHMGYRTSSPSSLSDGSSGKSSSDTGSIIDVVHNQSPLIKNDGGLFHEGEIQHEFMFPHRLHSQRNLTGDCTNQYIDNCSNLNKCKIMQVTGANSLEQQGSLNIKQNANEAVDMTMKSLNTPLPPTGQHNDERCRSSDDIQKAVLDLSSAPKRKSQVDLYSTPKRPCNIITGIQNLATDKANYVKSGTDEFQGVLSYSLAANAIPQYNDVHQKEKRDTLQQVNSGVKEICLDSSLYIKVDYKLSCERANSEKPHYNRINYVPKHIENSLQTSSYQSQSKYNEKPDGNYERDSSVSSDRSLKGLIREPGSIKYTSVNDSVKHFKQHCKEPSSRFLQIAPTVNTENNPGNHSVFTGKNDEANSFNSLVNGGKEKDAKTFKSVKKERNNVELNVLNNDRSFSPPIIIGIPGGDRTISNAPFVHISQCKRLVRDNYNSIGVRVANHFPYNCSTIKDDSNFKVPYPVNRNPPKQRRKMRPTTQCKVTAMPLPHMRYNSGQSTPIRNVKTSQKTQFILPKPPPLIRINSLLCA